MDSLSINQKFIELTTKADQGNKKAIEELNRCYNDKLDRKQDFNDEKLITFYQKKGGPYSINYLGVMYKKELGMEQSYDKTIELFEEGIKLNNSNAMVNLAILYTNGSGVEQSYTKAIELYEHAITLNNSNAMNNLALLYLDGLGVEQLYTKAIELFEQAIALDNGDAMYNLELLLKEDHKDSLKEYINTKIDLKAQIKNLKKENEKLKLDIEHYKYRPEGYFETREEWKKKVKD